VLGNVLIFVALWIGGAWALLSLWGVWCWYRERRQWKAKLEADRVVAMRRMSIHLVDGDLVSEEPPQRPFDHEVD
jgi:hypothetical protein